MIDEAQLSASNGGKRRHYSLRMKTTVILASLLLMLLVLEVGLRATFAVRGTDIRNYQPSFLSAQSASTQFDRSRFTSHPFLPYAGRPYDSRKLYVYREGPQRTLEFDVTNNSLGFRTPERPFAKPANTKRIITLGGSTTWEGPSNEKTWPALLEQKLDSYYAQSGFRVEVINLGVEMASSPTSLVNLAFIGTEFQPDLVISFDGVNDSFLMGLQGETPDYRSMMDRYDDRVRPLQSRLPTWAFRSYLLSVASRGYDSIFHLKPDLYSQVIASKTAQLKPAQNPTEGIQYFERNLRLMRAISSEHKAGFVASTSHWAEPSAKINSMNSELREFFRRNQIDYLDLDGLLPHQDWSIHSDTVHWTEKGLEQVADQWKTRIISSNLLGLNNNQ